MPAQRLESVFTLWKEAGEPEEKNHGKHARNRQAALKLEGYTASSARLNLH